MDFGFFFNSLLLGLGLAMDAFSVSLANGLNAPCMRGRTLFGIAGIFAFFQALMPLLGWACVHTVLEIFSSLKGFIPWIALILLCFIGGKMLLDGLQSKDEELCRIRGIGIGALLVQGVATSIDALSVGFTISEYDLPRALLCALLIAAVTFVICALGVFLGKKMGTRLSGVAGILGGCILIFIGLEIFLTSFFK